VVSQFYPDPNNQPFRGLPRHDEQRAITTGEAATVNTGRGKFKSFLDTFGKGVAAAGKATRETKDRVTQAVIYEDYSPPPPDEGALYTPHATSLQQPGELSLWSRVWANPLDARAGGSFSVASLADNPTAVRTAQLAYPSPDYGIQAQMYAYQQAVQPQAVAVPVESESIGSTAARGLGALITGKVSLSELKGEIAIVLLGVVLLALGLYIASK